MIKSFKLLVSSFLSSIEYHSKWFNTNLTEILKLVSTGVGLRFETHFGGRLLLQLSKEWIHLRLRLIITSLQQLFGMLWLLIVCIHGDDSIFNVEAPALLFWVIALRHFSLVVFIFLQSRVFSPLLPCFTFFISFSKVFLITLVF